LMLVTLVLTLRSFRQTLLIAIVGLLGVGYGLASLWLFGYPFGLTAIIGTLGLIGIVINDSIVVLCILSEDARHGRVDHQSMVTSIVGATRHVLSTSFTTVIGFAPLVLAGGSFWPPLAIVISGGVLGATLVSLTFVPCAFKLLYRISVAQSNQNLSDPSPQIEPANDLDPASCDLSATGVEQPVPIFPPIDTLAFPPASVGSSSIP
jgi:multidrug efflux pump subunit AcrB